MLGVIGSPVIRRKLNLSGHLLSDHMEQSDESNKREKEPLALRMALPGRSEFSLARDRSSDNPSYEGWLVTMKFCIVTESVASMTYYRLTNPSGLDPQYYHDTYIDAKDSRYPYSDLTLCRTFETMQERVAEQDKGLSPYQINAICLPRRPVRLQVHYLIGLLTYHLPIICYFVCVSSRMGRMDTNFMTHPRYLPLDSAPMAFRRAKMATREAAISPTNTSKSHRK